MAKELSDLLIIEIDRLDAESSAHKHLHRKTQLLIILLTALSSIVSGLSILNTNPDEARKLQFGVLAITTLVTAATAYGELRRSRELWQHEREVYYALKDLHRELLFLQGLNELTSTKQHEIFERAQSVLGSSSHKWANIQARKDPPVSASDTDTTPPAGGNP